MQLRNDRSELWAILPEALETLSRLSESEPPKAMAGLFSAPPQLRLGATTLISVRGPIMGRGTFFSQLFGLPSAEGIALQLRAALDDSKTKTIVFDIDSPGGTVAGNAELAEEIRAARKEKTIIAQVNPLAASAAFWIAAQASEVVVTPTSELGSIGVFIRHVDESGALQREGLNVSLISAGKFKTEGNPFEPLGSDAKEALQKRADDKFDMFIGAVAAGRDVSAQKVLEDFGKGRIVSAEDAVKAGMADRIDTLDGTLARSGRRGFSASGIRTTRELESLLRDAGGFSSREAKAIIAEGFKQTPDLRDGAEADDAAALSAIRSIANSLNGGCHDS